MEKEDPKPCAVCGTSPVNHVRPTGDAAAPQYFNVFCPNEDCPERPCTAAKTSLADAITAWNKGETI